VGETISATFITKGHPDDVEVSECPDDVEDVEIARMISDTSLEHQLAELRPRVILSSPGIYRGFQRLREALSSISAR
jgi:hypothetical protein